jgi:hypothetical protein
MASNLLNTPDEAAVLTTELRCALTGRALTPQEAYWAPPLITTRELLGAIFSMAMRNPGGLGQLLLGEQPNVPYAPEAREQLAARRSSEQLKLLMIILLIAAIIVVPIVLAVL